MKLHSNIIWNMNGIISYAFPHNMSTRHLFNDRKKVAAWNLELCQVYDPHTEIHSRLNSKGAIHIKIKLFHVIISIPSNHITLIIAININLSILPDCDLPNITPYTITDVNNTHYSKKRQYTGLYNRKSQQRQFVKIILEFILL